MDFGDFDCCPCPSAHIFMKYVNRLGMLKNPEIGQNAIKISFLDRHVKTTLKRLKKFVRVNLTTGNDLTTGK